MATIKRALYGLPIMRFYRDFRTSQLSRSHRDHPEGFRFAGADVFFSPHWESKEVAIVKDQLSKADVFIDAGANQGFYSCLAASRGVGVAAIEPEYGNLKFLLSNAQANGFRNLEIFHIAASNTVGIISLYGDGDMASSVAGWQGVSASFVQQAASNTLDNLFSTRWAGQRLFIKVDVEGAEMALIEGASSLLSREVKPNWLIETFPVNQDQDRTRNPNFYRLFETMAGFGYTCSRTDDSSVFDLGTAAEWSESNIDRGCNFLFEQPSV